MSYFVQQMADYRAGTRKSADPKKGNTNAMIAIAKAMTDEEILATAQYFGSMKWTPWIKVVESATVPKTRIAGGLFVSLPGGETEPLGMRIIEMPEDNAREALRDPRSGFVAYVPVGAIKKGEALVKTGGGKTTACAICHGADLKGLGPVPGLAGRSPSYSARQMFDMQTGARNGLWADLMKPVVAKLTEEDLINISAYTATSRLEMEIGRWDDDRMGGGCLVMYLGSTPCAGAADLVGRAQRKQVRRVAPGDGRSVGMSERECAFHCLKGLAKFVIVDEQKNVIRSPIRISRAFRFVSRARCALPASLPTRELSSRASSRPWCMRTSAT